MACVPADNASLTPLIFWWKPSDDADLKYLLSYSPYEQIKSRNTHLLLTVAKPDVEYRWSLKWLAKIRANDLVPRKVHTYNRIRRSLRSSINMKKAIIA